MRIENRRYCKSIVFYQPDFSDEMFRFGQLSLLLAGLGLSYYTAWVILLPFVDPEYRPLVARLVHNLFKTHFHACPPPKKDIYMYRGFDNGQLCTGSQVLPSSCTWSCSSSWSWCLPLHHPSLQGGLSGQVII